MTKEEFATQMDRLRDTFGDAMYSKERVKLMWRELGDFSCEWFERTIDGLIGSMRIAPLIGDFRESALQERERMRERERRDQASNAEQSFVEIRYTTPDKSFFEKLYKRMKT